MRSKLDIKTTIRGPVPRISYEAIARDILGNSYQVSLVLCGDRLAKRINQQYRKKSYAPNVLSFEIDENEGEIFLLPPDMPATVWGGPGSGERCALCNRRVETHQIEFEYANKGKGVRFHETCHMIWWSECERRRAFQTRTVAPAL